MMEGAGDSRQLLAFLESVVEGFEKEEGATDDVNREKLARLRNTLEQRPSRVARAREGFEQISASDDSNLSGMAKALMETISTAEKTLSKVEAAVRDPETAEVLKATSSAWDGIVVKSSGESPRGDDGTISKQ
mmetsp:Transcript_31118/g.81666  ORF Transcript_31118/g.81666 Transcript_31118/m.81666 type:complete len:133 (-) Transcript_31118:550-948(-)|eukprot:CAMPEP_0113867012 /NCGR_PEP_ID=MMETSP0780_2-20120614/186_1 /TAXON_ID=652834 /ORGANISM="Palpitomonas bilix" /LENGTH=132 /DNA_ID=CAMNT_0000851915 /DNA_START=35 /DNA_END=433 /DNA_ORIENTATION=+ /assembly_acc=CAM_ASM_000599